jgi:transcriptional regulator with XRE-family HTH domain
MREEKLHEAPLTPPVVRRIIGWSQVRVAGLAGVTPNTVRLYELDQDAVRDADKRRSLARVYAGMRAKLLEPPPP